VRYTREGADGGADTRFVSGRLLRTLRTRSFLSAFGFGMDTSARPQEYIVHQRGIIRINISSALTLGGTQPSRLAVTLPAGHNESELRCTLDDETKRLSAGSERRGGHLLEVIPHLLHGARAGIRPCAHEVDEHLQVL
jgi:hypothetical protein